MNAAEVRKYINDIKLERGCEICGYRSNSAVLQFDHLDPLEKWRDRNGKSVGIAQMTQGSGINGKDKSRYSIKTILAEIDKCRVLCANCHMEHTFPQYQVLPNTPPIFN